MLQGSSFTSSFFYLLFGSLQIMNSCLQLTFTFVKLKYPLIKKKTKQDLFNFWIKIKALS